jgi:hypothetical protein
MKIGASALDVTYDFDFMVALTGIEPVERHLDNPQCTASDVFSALAGAVLCGAASPKFPGASATDY